MFRAFDRHSGLVRWEYDIHQDGDQNSFHGDPLLTDDLVLVATDRGLKADAIGHVYAFEKATGRIRWKHKSQTGIASNVVQARSNVYVVTLYAELLCLDVNTGRLQWTYRAEEDEGKAARITSPAISGDRVFFRGRNGAVFAVDVQSGKMIWKLRLGDGFSTTPVVWQDALYVGSTDRHMYRLDQRDGAVFDSILLPAPPCREPACTEDVVLVYIESKNLACLDSALKEVRWTHKTSDGWGTNRPIVRGPMVYAADDGGRIAGISIEDGVRRDYWQFEGAIRTIGGAEGVLYVGTRSGALYAMPLETPDDVDERHPAPVN